MIRTSVLYGARELSSASLTHEPGFPFLRDSHVEPVTKTVPNGQKRVPLTEPLLLNWALKHPRLCVNPRSGHLPNE